MRLPFVHTGTYICTYAYTHRCDDISNLWRSLWEQLEERRKRLEVAAGLFKVFEEMKTVLQSMEEIKVCLFTPTYTDLVLYTYVCTYACIYIHMYVRMYICMYICMCICMHACVTSLVIVYRLAS